MIIEDYVSFEIAKLLKEKGFNEPCYACYINREISHYDYLANNYELIDGLISAPTIQMAMKWLRDIHGWFIHIDVIREASCWLADIQDIKNDVDIYAVEDDFSNYEEACEAAIKYCLENLI